jgi:hypothetical protein
MNLTGEQVEIDSVDSDDAGIDFPDAAQLKRGCRSV